MSFWPGICTAATKIFRVRHLKKHELICMPPQIDKRIANTEQPRKRQREARLPRLPSEWKFYSKVVHTLTSFVTLLSERDSHIARVYVKASVRNLARTLGVGPSQNRDDRPEHNVEPKDHGLFDTSCQNEWQFVPRNSL